MKTPLKIYLAGAAILSASAFSACTNTSKNNASYAADSANKAQIEKTDSANTELAAKKDSGNNEALNKADSANKAKKELKEDASKFLVTSYESSMFEIELGESAIKHATNPAVKKFAADLIPSHKDINGKMQTIAFDANFKLPGGIDSGHAKDLTDLEKLKGADYDKKFMDMIVSGHEKSAANYKKAYSDLSAGETKEFAGKTFPIINGHLETAKKIKTALK
jgi:putative membrane protein